MLVQLEAKPGPKEALFCPALSHEDLKVALAAGVSKMYVCGWVFVSKETVCVFGVWSLGRKLCCSSGMEALPWSTSSQTGSRFAGK